MCLRDKTNQSIYDSYKNYFNIDTFYKELEIRARVHKDFQQRHFVKVFKIKSLSARFSKKNLCLPIFYKVSEKIEYFFVQTIVFALIFM